jgi:hypothetical protein
MSMMARSTLLQLEAGYIDARPLTAQLVELSCNARPDHTFWVKTYRISLPALGPFNPRICCKTLVETALEP